MKLRYSFSTRWDFWRVATADEIHRVELFLGGLLLLGLLSVVLAVRWWLQQRGRMRPAGPLEHKLRLAAFGLCMFCALCTLYGFEVEPWWLQVTHVRLVGHHLPAGAGPIRIVQLSDLHCEGWPGPEQKVPERVAAEHPDLILFTGDAQNTNPGIATAVHCLSRLRQIAPVIAVRGNWDQPDDPTFPTLSEAGATEVDGKCLDYKLHGVDVRIGGIRAFHDAALAGVLQGLRGGDFTILMTHYPNYVDSVAGSGVDLYLAGHTHGGQICLPFYGALVTLARFGKDYESGLYEVGQTNIYVNRGIGEHTVHARFCCRPEITVFDIVRE